MAPSKLRGAIRAALRRLRRSRALRVLGIVLLVLAVLAVVADRALDGPLRGIVERRINRNLVGYSASIGRTDFHLFGLSLDLENAVVRQNAHPDPPVITVPLLAMSVSWRQLVYLRLVADAVFDNPVVHADLAQLSEENRDPVPLGERGWQRALESIYPLKINELRIRNGTLAYQDDSGFRPLHLTGVDLLAGNIRNIRSPERQYPSTIHAEGWVFDVGRAVIDGHADFLAEPTPGVAGTLDLDLVELSYFEPIARRLGFTVRQGFVSGRGQVEVAPGVQSVDVDSIVITAAAVDYLQGGAPTPQGREVGETITRVARGALNNPEVRYRIRELRMDNGTVGIVNRLRDPAYRLFVSNADFEAANVSSRAEDGPARVKLRGAFMGSGSAAGDATFHPEGKQANFEARVAIQDTQLPALNDFLRERGKFDVTRGTFSLYSQVRVKDGYVRGYVKPLFEDVDVYDHDQDKHKNILRKMYEAIVGGVAKMLENERGQVATVASLDGPVENPRADTLQVIGGLLKNAFIKAIRPGFQDQLARLNPLKHRSDKKKENKEEKAAKTHKDKKERKERREERASLH